MPLVALALLAGALFAYGIIRTATVLHERTRCQTAADATALAAATAYARGLNVCAASNHLLVPASILDAARVLAGAPPVFVPMVMRFQDAWAGTSSLQSLVVGAGLAPLYMHSISHIVGRENGLQVEIFWNGDSSAAGGLPELGVKRASPLDLIGWMTGAGRGTGPGGGAGDIIFEREVPKETFSYQPSRGGPPVEVPAGQVEQVSYQSGGKTHTRYRVKSPPGAKAGRFVSKRTVSEKIVRSFPVPMPLIETVAMHRVLVVGRALKSRSSPRFPVSVRSQAQAGKGEVFNAFMGDPSFEARLIPAAMARLGGSISPGGEAPAVWRDLPYPL